MLGWLILGALLGAAAIVIYVSFLDEDTLNEKCKENGITEGTIRSIVTSNGITHVTMDAMDQYGNEKEVEIQAESYNKSEIYVKKVITV